MYEMHRKRPNVPRECGTELSLAAHRRICWFACGDCPRPQAAKLAPIPRHLGSSPPLPNPPWKHSLKILPTARTSDSGCKFKLFVLLALPVLLRVLDFQCSPECWLQSWQCTKWYRSLSQEHPVYISNILTEQLVATSFVMHLQVSSSIASPLSSLRF